MTAAEKLAAAAQATADAGDHHTRALAALTRMPTNSYGIFIDRGAADDALCTAILELQAARDRIEAASCQRQPTTTRPSAKPAKTNPPRKLWGGEIIERRECHTRKEQIMTAAQHLTQHDKQIAAIRTLVKEGMQLVIATRQDMRSMRQEMRTMLESQKRTEKNLAALIAALGRGTNGKH